MPTVTYIEASGASHEVNIDSGTSLMQGAVDNMIEGIVAECGGSCSCATCHVIVCDVIEFDVIPQLSRWAQTKDATEKSGKET